jgi:RNA polymerase sigma factor (sigma-70 family)
MKISINNSARFSLSLNQDNPNHTASTLTIALINSGYKVSAGRYIQVPFAGQEQEDAYVSAMAEFEKLNAKEKGELCSDHFALKRFLFNHLRKFKRLLKKENEKMENIKLDGFLEIKRNGITEYIQRADNYERLYLGLECLTPDYQNLLAKYFFEGLTMKKIAKEYGISSQAIFKHIQKGLRDLRQLLNASGMNKQPKLSTIQVINNLFSAK